MIATIATAGIIIPLTTNGDIGKANAWITPLDVLSVNHSVEAIKGAIVYISIEYGFSKDQLLTTLKCESNFNANAIGDHGLAYGVAQFHKDTFDRYCKGNYFSLHDQIICMAQMWQKRMQTQWSCYKKYFKY